MVSVAETKRSWTELQTEINITLCRLLSVQLHGEGKWGTSWVTSHWPCNRLWHWQGVDSQEQLCRGYSVSDNSEGWTWASEGTSWPLAWQWWPPCWRNTKDTSLDVTVVSAPGCLSSPRRNRALWRVPTMGKWENTRRGAPMRGSPSPPSQWKLFK